MTESEDLKSQSLHALAFYSRRIQYLRENLEKMEETEFKQTMHKINAAFFAFKNADIRYRENSSDTEYEDSVEGSLDSLTQELAKLIQIVGNQMRGCVDDFVQLQSLQNIRNFKSKKQGLSTFEKSV